MAPILPHMRNCCLVQQKHDKRLVPFHQNLLLLKLVQEEVVHRPKKDLAKMAHFLEDDMCHYYYHVPTIDRILTHLNPTRNSTIGVATTS